MIYEVTMPALSSTMTEGKITAWQKKVGDKIAKGETIVVIESDKADMDAESFYEGFVGMITVPAGESAPVGAVIAYIAETEAEIGQINQKSSPTNGLNNGLTNVKVETAAPVSSATRPPQTERIIATPRAKRLAQQNGMNLAQINGSGPNGRITAQDIENLVKPSALHSSEPSIQTSNKTTVAPVPSSIQTVSKSVEIIPATSTTQPLTGLQQAVARNMNASLNVPTFQVGYTITTTALDQLYKQIKTKGVTMTALIAKAVAIVLNKHPRLNSAYTEQGNLQGILHKPDINIAIAVAIDDGGLITPVLKNADQMDIYSLSRQWKTLLDKARNKQLTPDEYNSGSFTISNLGMFGVDRFTAILPPNTGAILAVGASRPTVVATNEGAIAIKNQMQVNLTADHRIIYGADSAQFLKDLAELIENETDALTR